MHIVFLERFLHFAHAAAVHRTWPGAGAVDEIGDPDFTGQICTTERLPLLVSELKCGYFAVAGKFAAGEMAQLHFAEGEKAGRDEQWKTKKEKIPGTGF